MDVAHHEFLNDFDSTWEVKSLIMTWSNLVAMWKVRAPNGYYFFISPWWALFLLGWLYLAFFVQLIFSVCAQNMDFHKYCNVNHTSIQEKLSQLPTMLSTSHLAKLL